MSPVSHVIISAATSGIFWSFIPSWSGTLACFLSGIFLDLDHHFDYYLNKKAIPLSYKKLLSFSEKEKAGKPYLFLHSYELLALFWFSIFYFQWGPLWGGLAVGITVHIIADQLCNPVRPLSYFLLYRIKHEFHRGKLLTEKHYQTLQE